MSEFLKDFQTVTPGLKYPEGPVYQSDGSVLVVEIAGGTLTKVSANGKTQVLVDFAANPAGPNQPPIPCGPNGAAIGKDGAIYICDNGGLTWIDIPAIDGKTLPLLVPYLQPPNYATGSIKKVTKTASGYTFSNLYTQCNGVSLRSPDDLVFDEAGNFWFTDWGKHRASDRDITAIYYAHADGSQIAQPIPGRYAPNGIALSPDNKKLYFAETFSRSIWYWNLSAPGVLSANKATLDGSTLLSSDLPGQLDSMAVDEEGNIYAATMVPQGPAPLVAGGITVVSPPPNSKILEYIPLIVDGMPEPLPSNICFGGPDRKTAFITLAGTGRLVKCTAKIPGKKLNFSS